MNSEYQCKGRRRIQNSKAGRWSASRRPKKALVKSACSGWNDAPEKEARDRNDGRIAAGAEGAAEKSSHSSSALGRKHRNGDGVIKIQAMTDLLVVGCRFDLAVLLPLASSFFLLMHITHPFARTRT